MSSATTPAAAHASVVVLDNSPSAPRADRLRRSSVELVNPDDDVIVIGSPTLRRHEHRSPAEPIVLDEPPRKRRRCETSLENTSPPPASSQDSSPVIVVDDDDDNGNENGGGYEQEIRPSGFLPATSADNFEHTGTSRGPRRRAGHAFTADDLGEPSVTTSTHGGPRGDQRRRAVRYEAPANGTVPGAPQEVYSVEDGEGSAGPTVGHLSRQATSLPSLFMGPERHSRDTTNASNATPRPRRIDDRRHADSTYGLESSPSFLAVGEEHFAPWQARGQSGPEPITPDEIGPSTRRVRFPTPESPRLNLTAPQYGLQRVTTASERFPRPTAEGIWARTMAADNAHVRPREGAVNRSYSGSFHRHTEHPMYLSSSPNVALHRRRAPRAGYPTDRSRRMARVGRIYGPSGSHPMFTLLAGDEFTPTPGLEGAASTIALVVDNHLNSPLSRGTTTAGSRRGTTHTTTGAGSSSGHARGPSGLAENSRRHRRVSSLRAEAEREHVAFRPTQGNFRRYLASHRQGAAWFLRNSGGDQSMDYESLIRLDEQLIREKNRADKDQIEALPVESASAADKDIRCCVCMCDIEEGEELRVLPCSHKYHRTCIDEWLTYNGCCPVDKKRIGHGKLRSRCVMHSGESGMAH